MPYAVMPDLISLPRHVFSRGHPEDFKHWIPAFAGMTLCAIINAVGYKYQMSVIDDSIDGPVVRDEDDNFHRPQPGQSKGEKWIGRHKRAEGVFWEKRDSEGLTT